jgi:hypothetical protein
MATTKLRVKIGQHEFEAEGAPDEVAAQFADWKALISSPPALARESHDSPPRIRKDADESTTGDDFLALPSNIFHRDEKRRLVSLTVHPTGDSRDADALLLLLWGYKVSRGLIEVPVTLLKDSLEQSGIRAGRIDRAMAPHLNANLVLKGGHGKGGKYRLTNIGSARAEEIAKKLSE